MIISLQQAQVQQPVLQTPVSQPSTTQAGQSNIINIVPQVRTAGTGISIVTLKNLYSTVESV